MPQILFLGAGVIGIILLIIAVFLLFKVAEGIFRVFGLAAAIVITAFLVIGFLAFLDFMDIKENFYKSENLVIFEESGNVKGAAVLKEGNFQFLENFSSYNEQIKNKNYKELLDGYYKLIIVKNESLTTAGLLNIAEAHQRKNIIIYPETLLFKIIKRMPIGKFEIPFNMPNMNITAKGVI